MESFYVEYARVERLSEFEHCFKLTVLEVNIVFLNWCCWCGMAALLSEFMFGIQVNLRQWNNDYNRVKQ